MQKGNEKGGDYDKARQGGNEVYKIQVFLI